jgi:hypothetical protein
MQDLWRPCGDHVEIETFARPSRPTIRPLLANLLARAPPQEGLRALTWEPPIDKSNR